MIPTLKQKRVLVSSCIHQEQGTHQLVAHSLKRKIDQVVFVFIHVGFKTSGALTLDLRASFLLFSPEYVSVVGCQSFVASPAAAFCFAPKCLRRTELTA